MMEVEDREHYLELIDKARKRYPLNLTARGTVFVNQLADAIEDLLERVDE